MNKNSIKVLTGEEARRAVSDILDSAVADGRSVRYPLHLGTTGYFRDTASNGMSVYCAFDNLTGDCWCEDFRTEESAARWCRNELDTDEARALERNVEEIILNRDSFASGLQEGRGPQLHGGYPPYVRFDASGEYPLDMQFWDGYAFDTNPHGLGVHDRVALYYPTVAEVTASPAMQDEIKRYTSRDWPEGSRLEQVFDIALKYGQAGRIHCPQPRFDAAVRAVAERASDPSARSFTPAQRSTIALAAACHGESLYSGAFREPFYESLFSHAREQMGRIPAAWADDTRQELMALARGDVRDQHPGIHR